MFAFARHGDELSVETAPDISLSLGGPFGSELSADADNLVMHAAYTLGERAGVRRGARLYLRKELPVASGIGGGSADAAATLRLLNRFWQLDLPQSELLAIATGLGADVPASLLGQTCIGTGRGDTLSVLKNPGFTGKPLLLANPMIPVYTAQVFAKWDGVDRGHMPAASDIDAVRHGRNDLETPAMMEAPAIGALLNLLRPLAQDGMARMSGSGATCFALFEGDAARDQAAAAVRSAFPDYWTMTSHVR